METLFNEKAAAAAKPIEYPAMMQFGLPNCGIVAMAICSKTPLDVATEWFRKRQRVRSNWRGATRNVYYGEFLRERGVWFQETRYDRSRIRTVGDFAVWGVKPGVLYAVRTAGHMMVVRDGWIADQHAITPVRDHWCRNKRIKQTWEIFGG